MFLQVIGFWDSTLPYRFEFLGLSIKGTFLFFYFERSRNINLFTWLFYLSNSFILLNKFIFSFHWVEPMWPAPMPGIFIFFFFGYTKISSLGGKTNFFVFYMAICCIFSAWFFIRLSNWFYWAIATRCPYSDGAKGLYIEFSLFSRASAFVCWRWSFLSLSGIPYGFVEKVCLGSIS